MMEAAHKTKPQRIAELEERVKDLERQIAWLQAHISRDYYMYQRLWEAPVPQVPIGPVTAKPRMIHSTHSMPDA